MKTVKRLFRKCQESRESEYLALLDWRNTPSEGLGTSPAQRFLGRRCKTLLPVSTQLLQPRYSTEEDITALVSRKQKQKYYYDQHTKPLPPIVAGDTVWMRLPGQTTWSAGSCIDLAGPRSYKVKVGERIYRRNRRQLICADKQSLTEYPSMESIPQSDEPEVQNQDVETPAPSEPPMAPQSPSPVSLRRSDRVRRPPQWYIPD